MREKFTCFIISGVLGKILFEDSHEDGGQETRQQQHCYTRVDDAEPMDLQLIRPHSQPLGNSLLASRLNGSVATTHVILSGATSVI